MTNLNKTQLIEHFRKGEKPKDKWLIGTEHEVFLYKKQDQSRLPYEGEQSIHAILKAFLKEKWQPIFEKDLLIGAQHKESLARLSLEPGGQFELSGAPLSTLHHTYEELNSYYRTLNSICDGLNINLKGIGFDPYSSRENVPWMPKKRYQIMRDYMPLKGQLGLDMMLRTCTVQVNLDYQSERDMVDKFRVSMALQPFVVALFAYSSLSQGRPNGFQSYRSYIWQQTDPDRCGFLSFIFDKDMGYEKYTDYLLNVPMYFIYRQKDYINVAGASFQDFMKGALPQLPGVFPTLEDWVDQTSIAFPEVRLKQYLEMRGADSGPLPMLLALPAFWVGLLYDQDNLVEVLNLIQSWPLGALEQLYKQVPSTGLRTLFLGKTVGDYLNRFLQLSVKGLTRRNYFNAAGKDESIYLAPLRDILATSNTLADQLLKENSFLTEEN